MLEVTSVKVFKMEKGRMKAMANVVLNESLAIHGMRIIETDSRWFVAMPSKKDSSGNFRDVVHPINPDVRKHIEEVVLAEFEKQIGKGVLVNA